MVDYAIIDRCLEEAPGARPERDGMSLRYVSCWGWGWYTAHAEFWQIAKELDTPDALAVVEKALKLWLSKHPDSFSVEEIGYGDGAWEFRFSTLDDAAGEFTFVGEHPDRTTALAMLVMRVHDATQMGGVSMARAGGREAGGLETRPTGCIPPHRMPDA